MSRYSDETRKRLSEFQKKLWSDPEYAAQRIEKLRNTRRTFPEDFGQQSKERISRLWQDPHWADNMRNRQSEGALRRWSDPVKKAEFLEKRRLARERAAQEKKSVDKPKD